MQLVDPIACNCLQSELNPTVAYARTNPRCSKETISIVSGNKSDSKSPERIFGKVFDILGVAGDCKAGKVGLSTVQIWRRDRFVFIVSI